LDSTGGRPLSEKRRREIVEDIVRRRSTGARIPVAVVLGGEETELRDVITDLLDRKEHGELSEADRQYAGKLKARIRTRIESRLEELDSPGISEYGGEAIERECAGLNKALDILEYLDRRRHHRSPREAGIEDARRWLRFGRRITGEGKR